MRPLAKMAVIQIEITNACVRSCANCTRFCGHHRTPFFMELPVFEQAVASLAEFPGMIGIMGGEPTLHPQFAQLLRRYAAMVAPRWPEKLRLARQPIACFAEYIIENDLQNWSARRGLWTSLGERYYEHFELIQDVFEFQLVNDHSHPGLHQSLLVSRRELGIGDAEWQVLRDACWVQNSWSASITPKGAFFCEVAAALDMLFDGPGGWRVEPDWWQREPADFADQLHWCELCGACLQVPRVQANSEIDVVSPDMYKRLEQIGSRKLARGRVRVFAPDDAGAAASGSDYSSEWYLPDGDNSRRVAPTNRSLLPRSLTIVVESANEIARPEDWLLLVPANFELAPAFATCFRSWIFNPGCLYKITDASGATVVACHEGAQALRSLAMLPGNRQLLEQLWPQDKVIELDGLSMPEDAAANLQALARLAKQKSALMQAHVLCLWQGLVKTCPRLVLYGCGQHTQWLLKLLTAQQLPLPVLVIDDAPHLDTLQGIAVCATARLEPTQYDAVVASSDFHSAKMTARGEQLWAGQIPVIDLYAGFADPRFQK